jgi:hypothetical protein
VKVMNVSLVTLLLAPTFAAAQPHEQRLETGLLFTYAHLEKIGSTDHGVGSTTAGVGGRIAWRLMRYLDVEGELGVHPSAGVRGYRIQGFVGAKSGVRFNRVGLFAKARPGFLYFSKDPFGAAEPDSAFLNPRWADSLEPALDIGVVAEYYSSNDLLIRFDVGDTIVTYDARSVFVSQREPRRPVAGFATRNRQWSLGVGKRF